MNSDDNATWSPEQIKEYEHDEWLRAEAMGGESLTDIWGRLEAERRNKEEEREEEEEPEEDPYEK